MAKKIMIDPGHAPGNANRGPTGYYEYAGMWALSNYLKTVLERCGCIADLTRTEKKDPSLSARGKKAKGYDLFMSEHSNAGGGKARGCEVFRSLRIPGDKTFAADLAAAAAAVMGNNNRGVKTRESTTSAGFDWLSVMYNAVKTGCPHVILCESGFHDNAEDEAILKSDSKLKEIAEAQAKVICKHLGVKYIDGKPAPVEKAAPKIGDKVQFKGGSVYSSSSATAAAGTRKAATCQITGIATGAAHPYHCIGGGVYGWVNAADIGAEQSNKPASKPVPAVLKVGDRVKIIGTPTYYGSKSKVPLFIRMLKLYARQIGNGKVLISPFKSGAITGWVAVKDIKKV